MSQCSSCGGECGGTKQTGCKYRAPEGDRFETGVYFSLYKQLQGATRKWHAECVANGYDGVSHALDTLFAMKKGPRRLEETK